MEAVRVELRAPMSDKERSTLCDALVESSASAATMKALSAYAGRTAGVVAAKAAHTQARLRMERPEIDLAVALSYADAAPADVRDYGLWMVALGLLEPLCALPSPRDPRSTTDWLQGTSRLAQAWTHWALSEEAQAETILAQPGQMTSRSRRLSSLRSASKRLGPLLDRLLVSEWSNDVERSFNLELVSVTSKREGELPVRCEPKGRALRLAGPHLKQAGGFFTTDMQAVLEIECVNESPEQTLFSESLFPEEEEAGCVADATEEIVIDDLRPGESATLRVGPLLVSSACPSEVVRRYSIRSSHHPGVLTLGVSIRAPSAMPSLVPVLDEDEPGSSREDRETGLGPDDTVEVHLGTDLSPRFDVEVLPILGSREENSGLHVLEAGFTFEEAMSGGLRRARNDLDLRAADWPVRRPDLSSVRGRLAADPARVWVPLTLRWRPRCQEVAEALPSPHREAYRATCGTITFEEYREVIIEAAVKTCMVAPRGPDSLEADASLVDPRYSSVVAAIVALRSKRVLSPDVTKASLHYLDGLVASPLFEGSTIHSPGLVDRDPARALVEVAQIASAISAEDLGAQPPQLTGLTARDVTQFRSALTQRLVRRALDRALGGEPGPEVVRVLGAAAADVAQSTSCGVAAGDELAGVVVLPRLQPSVFQVNRLLAIPREPRGS